MQIGFIGLGIMGEAMSENLVKKSGASVMVYDIDSKQVDLLVKRGAAAASDIAEIGRSCDVIFSMVPESEHVKAVYSELIPVLKSGKITVDMSTIDPEVSVELSREVGKTGAIMLDAPVVKSRPAAEKGELGIYVGGDNSAFEKVKSLLACMGSNIIRMGDNGKGLYMKIVHNALVAQIQNSVNEMLVFGEKCGISIDDMVTAISYGGAKNFYLDTKHAAIRDSNFKTMFSVENMNKDLNIALKIAAENSLNLPGLKNAREVYSRAMNEGIGKEDFSATYKIVKK